MNLAVLDKKVRLHYKDINNIRREIFVESTITELDLSSKSIVAIENYTFANLSNLKILWLNGNNISYLEKHAFKGLDKLERLYLYYNKIKYLPKGIFDHLKNLKRIEFSMNQLTTLDKDIFNQNQELEKISFDFNQIFELPEGIFTNNKKLQTIVLSSNNLISLQPGLFEDQHNLKFLSLSFNSLSSLPVKLFPRDCLLEEIRLDNNPFKILDLSSFQYTKHLNKIDILYCTGLEQIIISNIVHEIEDLKNVPDAKIDFSASPVSQPPPVIITRGLRALIDFYAPGKTIYSSLTEIKLAFGIAGPEVKVDKCILCKKSIYEKDRNICKECEMFYDDPFGLGV